jgi:acetate kinase
MSNQFGLAVNCGSSSIKFQLYQITDGRQFTVTAAGAASNLGSKEGVELKLKHSNGAKSDELTEEKKESLDQGLSHEEAFAKILKLVTSDEVLGEGGKEQVKVIAHRYANQATLNPITSPMTGTSFGAQDCARRHRARACCDQTRH